MWLASGSSNVLCETVNPQGAYTNEEGYVFKYRADRYGSFTEFGNYVGGSSSDVVNTDRDSHGQPVRIRLPDAGAGRPTFC